MNSWYLMLIVQRFERSGVGLSTRKQAGERHPPGSLPDLLRRAVAVDGTFLEAAAEITWAVQGHNHTQRECWNVRLDFQVAVEHQTPELIVVSEPGESESAFAAANVRDGRI